MIRAQFVCLIQFLAITFPLSQSNPNCFRQSEREKSCPRSVRRRPTRKHNPGIFDGYGKLPLGFEADHGQTDSRMKFLSEHVREGIGSELSRTMSKGERL
jgi:hypothetical protein